MLKHSAEAADARESVRKRAAIVAALVPPSSLDKPGEATPSRARRMSDDRMRAAVETRVSRLVPRVDTIDPEVHAAALDVESCDGHFFAPASASRTH